jgi:hypothetical protein
MKYWINEKTVIKASHMSNAQGNQKKPSKYKHGGRTGIEATLVSCTHFPYKYFSFPSVYYDGMANGCVWCVM